MGDAPAAQPKSKSGTFGFLTRKIGPVPIWLIGLGIAGGYYWYTHYGPGAQKAAAAAQPKAQRPQVIVVTPGGKTKGTRPPKPAPGTQPAAGPAAGPAAAAPAPAAAAVTTKRTVPGPNGRNGNRPVFRRREGSPPPSFPGAQSPPQPPQPPADSPPPPPVTAAAPMTGADVYGDLPTANLDGSTYQSGFPASAQLEGSYVSAG